MHSAAAPAHTGVVSVGRSALGTANRAGTPAGASASFRTASRGRGGPGVCSHRSSSAPSPRNICPNAIGRSHKLISNRGLCELRPFVHEGPYFIGHRLGKLIDLQNLFGGLSPACDFVDLVQNGFCTRPVAPLQGSFERRSCTSTTVSRHRIHPPNRFWTVERWDLGAHFDTVSRSWKWLRDDRGRRSAVGRPL